MNNLPSYMTPKRQTTFKQVDVGQKVVLTDEYLLKSHHRQQLEAIVLQTMENAERRAREVFDAAQQEAQQIVENARLEAQRIIEEEGVQQRDIILSQAYEEGYQAGLTQGVELITQDSAEKIKTMNAILDQTFQAKEHLFHRHQAQVVELLQYVLSLVLPHEIQTSPEQLASLMEQAANRLQLSGTVKLTIHPETLHQLLTWSPALSETLQASHRIVFQPNPGCEPYDVYLESVEQCYDVSPETQARILLKKLEPSIEPLSEKDLAMVNPLSDLPEPASGIETNQPESPDEPDMDEALWFPETEIEQPDLAMETPAEQEVVPDEPPPVGDSDD